MTEILELRKAFTDMTEAIRYAQSPFQYEPPADLRLAELSPALLRQMFERLAKERPEAEPTEASLTALVRDLAREFLQRGQKVAIEAFRQIEAADQLVQAERLQERLQHRKKQAGGK